MENLPGNMALKQTGDGSWTLFHPDFGEEFHSKDGAWQETELLYMRESGFRSWLLDSARPRVTVLDVGLGLGYNALGTIQAWFDAPLPPPLHLLSLEFNPELVATIASGEMPWGQEGFSSRMLAWCRALQQNEQGYTATLKHPSGVTLVWDVLVGDGTTADLVRACADAKIQFVFQDAFSPKKNPELWSDRWFAKVAEVALQGAVLVTYSAARVVRDNLAASGWQAVRIPATTHKRHWLKASLFPAEQFPSHQTE